MMYVCQQTHLLLGRYDFKAVERPCTEVERTHEVMLVLRQFFFAHLLLRNINSLFQVVCLHDTSIAIAEMNGQLRMMLDEFFKRICQCLCIDTLWESNSIRYIIEGC